jgi:hypothetical protein
VAQKVRGSANPNFVQISNFDNKIEDPR